jgi:hypothetical protein
VDYATALVSYANAPYTYAAAAPVAAYNYAAAFLGYAFNPPPPTLPTQDIMQRRNLRHPGANWDENESFNIVTTHIQ